MAFRDEQRQSLSRKLNPKHVRTRVADGKTLSYVEGWHVIAEANRIFGYDAWDRETIQMQCVWEGARNSREACTYMAQVRISVRAGELMVVRMGSGTGHGIGLTRGEAHENALKMAETDAMKRALATFGNPFGLPLYDSEQRGVRKERGHGPNPIKSHGSGRFTHRQEIGSARARIQRPIAPRFANSSIRSIGQKA